MVSARCKLIDADNVGAESAFAEAVCDLKLFSQEEQAAGDRRTPTLRAGEMITLSFAQS
ncbi:MAG: hypothetical protein U0L71_05550 [Eggerthellaceae bacterium]|nr:hypothetical protein [Eggerthellaceae bacterium]